MKTLLMVLLYTLLIDIEGLSESKKPRKSVSFSDVNLKQFKEFDFDSLSSLMVRDDIGQLILGARGKVIALSLDDITKETSEETWAVSSAEKALCQMKGKSSEECENFIRILHSTEDGNMFVCGTNAFNPACTYMNFTDGKLFFEKTPQDGRGKVPFDPYQEFASFMDGNTLFSATSSNFLGTEMVFQRHGPNPIKTETKLSWLKEPTMISIVITEVSKYSENNEDDNVFLFFTENAVEELRSNVRVSRIARVCKSDLGGLRTLQQKWTSFLKARLDCPFGDAGSPALVQDVYFLKDKTNWTDSVFYATFTSNPEPSSACIQSAVCAYRLSDIRQVFRGTFLTESDTGSWDTYTGVEPYPYPGSCIDDEMRASGVMTSLNLSDTTLLFVKSHPLMEGVVTPITGKPLLVQASTQFTKVVVDQVTSLDGQQHHVIFIGTNSGWLQKAVRFGGEEGRIIEELQLFQDAQFIDFLQLFSRTGQLYSGARNTVVQVNVRGCGRYTSCEDCLLARDPYCGWDVNRRRCDTVVGASKLFMIQDLMEGNTNACPNAEWENNVTTVHLAPRIAQFLPCTPDTNLPVSWRLSGIILHPGPRHRLLSQGLIICPSSSDAGLYTCETVETVKGREHRTAVVQYLVKVQNLSAHVLSLQIAVILLACFAAFLICLAGKYLRAAKLKRVGNQICNSCQQRTFHQRDQVNQRCSEQSLHHHVRDAASEGAGATQVEESRA
ncbi:semaphorin-4E-like [Nematolebias whitei]|uniref:semaphorin-4E-like n=1 Tax=Nematolebias whitei TaxID=451745 RepID=UPI0018988528|nr:semaphorin-4E-like [Nematolebias whitei]